MAGTLLRRVASLVLILTFAVSVMAGHLAMAKAASSMGPSQLRGAGSVDDPSPCDQRPGKAMATADCKAMCGGQSAILPASPGIVPTIAVGVWNLAGVVQPMPGIKPALAPPQS